VEEIMYYAITNYGVRTGKTLPELNKKLNGKLEDSEFTFIGSDAVVKLNSTDIDFIQDKKRMSQIMFSNFFKKDNSVKMFAILTLIFEFVILVKG
jgi:hypothetical protein